MAALESNRDIVVDPELQAAVERVLRGDRDFEAMRRAAVRMDEMRREMRRRVGNVDLAVPLIREARNGERRSGNATNMVVQSNPLLG